MYNTFRRAPRRGTTSPRKNSRAVSQNLSQINRKQVEDSHRVRISSDPPVYDVQPEYARRVRFKQTLTSEAPAVTITPASIATAVFGSQSGPNSRIQLRFESIRIWATDQSSIQLSVNDTPDFTNNALHTFEDDGVPGSRRACIGVRFSRQARLTYWIGTDDTTIATVTSVPPGLLIADASVVFRVLAATPAALHATIRTPLDTTDPPPMLVNAGDADESAVSTENSGKHCEVQ